MLTNLTIRGFKIFDEVEIELGNPVIFMGPNNSGKTAALQALALWNTGLKKWLEKRSLDEAPEKRPGVAINRRDLTAIPTPTARLLWRLLKVRDVRKVNGKTETSNVRIDILVEGVSHGEVWSCGLEFDYSNEESFYCRPLRLSDDKNPNRMPIPKQIKDVNVAFLPPMSGLAEREFFKQPGEIDFLIGQGRTAEVLRNLCFSLMQSNPEEWEKIKERIHQLFHVHLDDPNYLSERSEIEMTYTEPSGVHLALSSSGRGLQQTLLVMTYMALNPDSVLMLDEPDAHLEILRQRQMYRILGEAAVENGGQIIAASHSEILLNEAANRDVVIAFLYGKTHRIDDRGSQLRKWLAEFGIEDYYLAEKNGWVLYLEGSTDLAILQDFAETLKHSATEALQRPFVHYVGREPGNARKHFYGLKEAKQDLVGFALFDRLEMNLHHSPELALYMWKRREIENYLCNPQTLLSYVREAGERDYGPLFTREWEGIMENCIEDFVPPAAFRDLSDPWWRNMKASDDFLDRVFDSFFKKVNLPNRMRKSNYHVLARHVPSEQIDAEIVTVLDMIFEVSQKATPLAENTD